MNSFQFAHATTLENAIQRVVRERRQIPCRRNNLIDLMKDNVEKPPALVDLRRLKLREVLPDRSGGVMIQSGVSNSALANHPLIRTQYPVSHRRF